jgi:hypothetical protein
VSEIPDLDRLLSAFSLGELWLAFSDGKDEAGLFEEHPDHDFGSRARGPHELGGWFDEPP